MTFWALFLNLRGRTIGGPTICYGVMFVNGLMTMCYDLTLGLN